jgi:hypothetical protein
MEKQAVIDLIRQELPDILQSDEDMREWVIQLTRPRYADRLETESRFDRMLEQLKLDREESARQWNEQSRKLDEYIRKSDEKWEANQRKWEASNQKWEASNQKWEANNQKWEENHRIICKILDRIEKQEQKHNASIGALGARWGLSSEAAFRNGLKAILEKSFGVEVKNVTEYDAEGRVFGKPDQVELDVIIHNGLLILCEIKSSISKSDMVIFSHKTDFYEQKHDRKADRKLVISPMVDDRARPVAEREGIEIYSHSIDVKH